MQLTRKQFEDSIIAQDDDESYSESGWVAGIIYKLAYLVNYSHCSCYGTFTSIGEKIPNGEKDIHGDDEYSDDKDILEVTFDWFGTVDELIDMAKNRRDPIIFGREQDPEDYDYDHLMKVYSGIIKWDMEGRKSCLNFKE
jgi:hypothetical protein